MTLKCKDRIFLVGPMGAGKSSIGKALALVTERPFLDIDDEIVKYAGRSIPQIFEDEGESGFRAIETEVLKHCLKIDAIIATGGGIVVTEENIDLLRNNGLVIYLYADVNTQYMRTLRDNNRPMIAVEDRRQRLQDIFSIRDPLYCSVNDIRVDSGTSSIHECVEQIKMKLRELEWNL
ncbi:MAG: shikimate kinase [Succinivibrio sp.]